LLIGFDYPLVGGLITMVGELLPVVGPIAAAVPIVALALVQSPTTALAVLVLYVVLQRVEGQLLTPNIMNSQTHISQVLALLALFAGGALGGILGALVAIPLAAALRVFVLRVVAPAVRRWTGADESAAPAGRRRKDPRQTPDRRAVFSAPRRRALR
jgi:predicted PurR-regulated permease PerM